MCLKDYLQYEIQKRGKSREAEKQISKEAGKSRNPKNLPKTGKKHNSQNK